MLYKASPVSWERSQPQAASLLHQSHVQLYMRTFLLSQRLLQVTKAGLGTTMKSVHSILQLSKYFTGWLGRSESLKKGRLKVYTLKKFSTMLCTAKFFSTALCAVQHSLYTINLLPTPMKHYAYLMYIRNFVLYLTEGYYKTALHI